MISQSLAVIVLDVFLYNFLISNVGVQEWGFFKHNEFFDEWMECLKILDGFFNEWIIYLRFMDGFLHRWMKYLQIMNGFFHGWMTCNKLMDEFPF